MQEQISLKQAEQKVFKTAVNDGLWDMLVGGFLLQFAVAPLLSTSLGDFWSSAVFIPFWGMLFLLIWLLRKYVVAPRIGTVKFGPARRRELSKFTIVMLIMNLIAFFAGLYTGYWTIKEIEQYRKVDTQFYPKMEDSERDLRYKKWKKAVERSFDWA